MARPSSQLTAAAVRADDLLAVACLSFGTALAAFVPASLEQRIGALFFFGLIPAVGIYLGNLILSQLLMPSSELCGIIAACCFRYVVLLVNDSISWVGPRVSNSLAKVPALRQKAYYLGRGRHRRVQEGIFQFSCLLIRSAAKFIMRIQASQQLRSGP